MAGDSLPVTRLPRPVLFGSLRTPSYVEEHQQYRPPHQDGHQGIDSMIDFVDLNRPTPKGPIYKGVPSPQSPPRVVESGINHSFSHANCQPPAGQISHRMTATLFYRAHAHRVSNSLAPTADLSAFPLEPPPPDPEPLDHLYGSYISPLCMTSFLDLMASLPLPPGSTSLSSSHRCLDTPTHPRVVEISFSPTPDPTYLTLADLRKHELLYRFEREWNIDVVLQPDTPLRRHPRLVVFDMDSTLIREEVIDLVAARKGVQAHVAAITARAMQGELDFAASLRERVGLLQGVPASIFTDLRAAISLSPGVRALLRALKRLGVVTAVLSGGFIPLTSWLAADLGLDHAHANSLGTVAPEDGHDGPPLLTGHVEGPIVDAARKAQLLRDIAAQHDIGLDQVVAVGDGANDLLMMREAGLGVAFNAKPRVQLEADARLNGESLLDLLFLFGFTAEEIGVLIR